MRTEYFANTTCDDCSLVLSGSKRGGPTRGAVAS